MYNFFCKPLKYSFVIMRALQKNTNILVKTKHFTVNNAYKHIAVPKGVIQKPLLTSPWTNY